MEWVEARQPIMRDQQARLIFLDETSTTTKMTRARGRFQKGERLKATAPFGHWCTQTLIAGLKSDGLIAPFVVNAPMNRVIFDTYVETQLAPQVRAGDVVILDNLGSHKGKAVRKAVKAAGARLLFLPKYSPDLNPIEQVFAKLKHLMRKAAERTHEATWRRIGYLLDDFPKHECANYLKNSGYGAA